MLTILDGFKHVADDAPPIKEPLFCRSSIDDSIRVGWWDGETVDEGGYAIIADSQPDSRPLFEWKRVTPKNKEAFFKHSPILKSYLRMAQFITEGR